MLGNSTPDLLAWEFDIAQESPCNTNESILGPRSEPIDSSVVDQTGELASSLSERVPDRRETQVQMQVVSHLSQEEVE
jgi:hypothetical protein